MKINQDRLNWCVILHIHNNDTDALDLNYLANEFVSQNSFLERLSDFAADVKLYKCMHLNF